MSTLTANEAIDKMDQIAYRSEAEAKAEKRVSEAKTRFVLCGTGNVFFATLVLRLKFKVDWDIGTAATDGRHLFYCPDFVAKLNDDQLIGVLCHEAMHCSNKHFSRMVDRNPQLWNIAADIAINPLIIESGMKLPNDVQLPDKNCLGLKLPPNLAAEEYYALIMQQVDIVTVAIGDGDDPGGCGGVIPPKDDDGNDLPSSEVKQLEAEWEANVAAAATVAKQRGQLSAGLQRMIGAVLAPVRDWKEELRHFVTVKAKHDYSWKRPNRRFVSRGLYLPSVTGDDIGHVVVMVDTSGSIGDATLQRFASEMNDIARQGVTKMSILFHDSVVIESAVQVWTPEEGELVLKPAGGGGTSHKDCFRWIDENCDEPPAVAIALTDMYSEFPSSGPEYPMLWVSTTPGMTAPFGELITIPEV